MSVLPKAEVTLACPQMEEKKRKQQQPVRTDYWLQPNIVVKVVTKKLGERYHKRKGVVTVRPFPRTSEVRRWRRRKRLRGFNVGGLSWGLAAGSE